MVDTKLFLEHHRSTIVQKTRNPIRLADTLLEEGCITDEIYYKIKDMNPKTERMREIYSSLNSKKHYDCMYGWLQEHEADLLTELKETNNDSDAPQNKKSRLEFGDELDNNLTKRPDCDLRKISYAKLERWISQPQTNQKLVNELKRKIGEKAVEDLRKELRDKESRKCLCFKANQIDEIRRNTKLDNFIEATKIEYFPKLAISMFFRKGTSASSANTTGRFAGCDESKVKVKMEKSNVPMCADKPPLQNESQTQEDKICVSTNMHQSDQIEIPVVDGTGSTDMKEPCSDKKYEEPPRSDVPMQQKEIPVEDAQQETQSDKVDDEPQRSQNVPGLEISQTLLSRNMNMMVSEKEQMQIHGTIMKDRKNRKKKEKETWLRDWALSQCHGREEELKDILDQISIIDVAEHPEYPCFVAEDVMVYKYLTPDSQILFVAKENTSINTKTMVQYHMFVCNIKKAIVLGPKSPKVQELQYEASKVPLEKCKNLIFKAFAPALAIYKHIQKEKHLLSLI